MQPPCKHYESSDELLNDAYKIVNQPEYKKVIAAGKRDNLIKELKRLLNKGQMPMFNQDASHQFLDGQSALQYNESQSSEDMQKIFN